MKAHPILGHRSGDESKWLDCGLNKILVKPREIHSPEKKYTLDTKAPVKLPEHFQWGLGGDPEAQHLLFDSLPHVAAEQTISHINVTNPHNESVHQSLNKAQWEELPSVHMLARITDLRNANARGIAFENRRRCVEAFSSPDKPNDTGRPEVQAALLTMKIRNLHEHLQRCKKDVANRRAIRHLVHARAKILKYLKRLDRERFVVALEKLGIEESAIEGELISNDKLNTQIFKIMIPEPAGLLTLTSNIAGEDKQT
ncbi:hypothetical protein Clacol_001948 [Clathrus columnatus]|uniref:30S ribosomal protein S15 n=1 Tax=Clathrus columnatus TaxID=1419009 RepID=A0AAV5A2L7_9AGAM|nr:hypothetical protein Clacol_001948 [Clathrus columnatus]